MINERRKTQRRISDDCSQCDIWKLKIESVEKTMEAHALSNSKDIKLLHGRIDKAVTKWVLIIVMAAYVGLASFNAVTGRNLIIEMTEARTQIKNIEKNVERIEAIVKK